MEPQQTDILIIGAGLTGLTTGFWLTRAGKDIHILEKEDLRRRTNPYVPRKGFCLRKPPPIQV